MQFLQRLFPPLAFFGGFVWDALTIGQRVKPLDLWLLGVFLLAAGTLILWLARREANGRVAPVGAGWRGRVASGVWQAPYLLLQFFFGGIFSALTPMRSPRHSPRLEVARSTAMHSSLARAR